MKKLLSLMLSLMFVFAAPLGILAEEGGDLFPSDEQIVTPSEPTQAPIQEPTQKPTEESTPEPTKASAEESTPEPTEASAEESTPEPTEASAEESTPEPTEASTEESTPESTEEPAEEPTEELTQEPTEEPEPEPEAAILPAPANLSWGETGNIFFDTITPATESYRVTIYRDEAQVKELPIEGVSGEAQSLMIPADEILSEAGEYTFAVVALGFDQWLDSEPAVSPPFRYEPGDPFADMDPISALVAMVEAGEMTALEARDAYLAMSARDVADLLLESQAARSALSTLEVLYMQAAGIGLGIDVEDDIKEAQLVGVGLNAWEGPQELRMYVAAEAEEDSLGLSFALEALQPEPDPAQPHPGASVAPIYVTLPMPEGFAAEEASLTNGQGEGVPFVIRDQRIAFVSDSLGEYRMSHWPVSTGDMPVVLVRLGEALIMPDELERLGETDGEEALVQEGQPVEVEQVMEMLAVASPADEEWASEDENVAVMEHNGLLFATSIGETVVTQTDADGGETQVLVQVTPLEAMVDDSVPYAGRVLPQGAIKSEVPLRIAPAAYGLNQYTTYRTSNLNAINRVSITLEGMVVNVDHTSSLPGRVEELIRVTSVSGVGLKDTSAAYAGNGYAGSFYLPVLANGKYVFRLYDRVAGDLYYQSDFTIYFYCEDGKAYFYYDYADTCNNGSLMMMASSTGEAVFAKDMNYMLNWNYNKNGFTYNLAAVSAELKALAQSLTAGASTQYGKVLAIHTWIADNIAYDNDAWRSGTYHANPYQTYIQRRGVCSGYSNLQAIMLYYVGIRSIAISGYADSFSNANVNNASTLENHQWNAVEMNGTWWLCDVTWDASRKYENGEFGFAGQNKYRFFLPTFQLLSVDHRAMGIGMLVSDPAVIPSVPKDLTPIEAFVTRLYENVLGRSPDLEGLIYWRDILANGTVTGGYSCGWFYTSPEFTSTVMTDDLFITNLYNTCFNRAPDAGGMNYWKSILDAGATRNSVLNWFITSPEFTDICKNYGIVRGSFEPPNYRDKNMQVTLFVARLYRLFLGRVPETDGVEYWCKALLLKQQTGSQAARGFVESAEFRGRPLSDSDYVEIVYNGLLGRSSEAEGKAYWLNRIATDGRNVLFNGFVGSKEWRSIMDSYGIR